jgi:hypothetical protein
MPITGERLSVSSVPAGSTFSWRRGRALRVDRARVRTAVWSLIHPETGRNVTLVGTMHIGDPGYFGQLSAVLDRLADAGAEVQVEGISHAPGEVVSEWERERLDEADAWADPETTGAAVDALQLQPQGTRLGLPRGARNIDMTYVELLRHVGWEEYRRLLAPQPDTGRALHLNPVVRAAMRFQLRHSRALLRLTSLRPRARRVTQVILGARNQVAFAGAMEALRTRDVVLVWGTDHLPGLARLFAGAGYRPGHEAWFDACTI